MLLLAAADDTGELDVLRRAASRPRSGRAGLGGRLGLRAARRRRDVGLACATRWCGRRSTRPRRVRTGGALTGRWPRRWPARGDPDREAWHRASAADGPDPSWSTALELVGSRAQRRGGHVAALAAYERAASSRDRPGAACRVSRFAAARSAWACGQAGQAQALLSAAREAPSDPLLLVRHRAPARTHRGQPRFGRRGAPDLRGGRRTRCTRSTRSEPWTSASPQRVMRTYGADSGTPLPVADAPGGSRRRRLAADAVPASSMLVAMTHVAEGDWSAARRPWTSRWTSASRWTTATCCGTSATPPSSWATTTPSSTSTAYALSRAREAGAVTAVIYCLQRLCFGHYLAGDLVAVRSSAEEAIALADEHRPTGDDRPARSRWLALLAALQDRDDYDDAPATARGARHGAPPGHPDRPRARPDPLGQGAARRGRRGQRRRPAPPQPVPAARARADVGLRSGSRRPSAPGRPRPPGLGRGAGGLRRSHRPAVGARHGRLRAGADGRPGRRRGARSRRRWSHARAGRSPARRGAHPAGLRRVAAPQPAARRRPPAPAPAPSRPSRTCGPRRWPHGPTRSCAPRARPRASATPPPW